MKDSQIVVVNGNALTERDMYSAIDSVVDDMSLSGSMDNAVKVLNALDKLDNVTGHVKAKLLWHMSGWFKVNNPTEDFGDDIESKSSTKRVTVERYVNVWEQIQQERIPKKIQSRPMRDLVPIAKMLQQGFDPTKEEWAKVSLASNSSELSEVIRQIKGKSARKSGMTIQMERDGGLWAYKDKTMVYVGYLDLTEKDELLSKAIERIIDGANIIRR